VKRTLILAGSCLLLVLLWLPGLQYPILSDTAYYALLGESLWTHGRYELQDLPYAKHLPLHAFLSYPLIPLLSFSVGMKVASLLAGIATILLTYLVLRESFSERVALFAAPLVAVHHGLVLMTMLGSADLLFTALFLAALYAFLRAEDDQRWYIASGIAVGLASLTRYNGVPIFGVFVLAVLLWRREDLRSLWFYAGAILGSVLFSLWLWRNFRVFGNPLHTLYTEELSVGAPQPIAQMWDNLFYYLDPSHNILPILMGFAIYGIVKEWRRQKILLLWILGVWVLTSFWWVQSIRFAFPAYPLLIGFGIVGLRHCFRRFAILGGISLSLVVAAIVLSHAGALCLYSFGTCNSMFDRTLGLLPKNLGLTSEGLYTWGVARHAANTLLPNNAIYVATGIPRIEKEGFFRQDIRVVEGASAECPHYRITQSVQPGEKKLYETEDHPVTYVTVQECQ
jgi:4-amino-4-deoxy-L-arabinose transferase-like glycosyltransferase